VKPDWKRLAGRARTPLALILAAIEARSQQAPAAAVAAIVERFGATVADWAQLFIALLFWTQRLGLRQAAWQEASPAAQLTAIWCHSDQILDLLIGSGISAAGLAQLLSDWKGQIQGIDIIGLAAGGEPDASAPAGISRAVLLYHGLAAIFGGEDVSAALPADLPERIQIALVTTIGEVTSPDVMLLMWSPTRSNLLGGFLNDMPVGVPADNLDPVKTRQLLVEGALAALETGGDLDAAWSQLAAFGSGGLDSAQHERLKAVIEAPPLPRWRKRMATNSGVP
jgi:hypothetical protein